jgi:hypothetical protein
MRFGEVEKCKTRQSGRKRETKHKALRALCKRLEQRLADRKLKVLFEQIEHGHKVLHRQQLLKVGAILQNLADHELQLRLKRLVRIVLLHVLDDVGEQNVGLARLREGREMSDDERFDGTKEEK